MYKAIENNILETCYNRSTNDFDIAWPERVSRHDVVYLSPPSDPMQYGMPIGNGDIGALVWCDDRRIIIAFNKCDLWDDASFTEFKNWERSQEEYNTTLRHACRIIIDFGSPIFDAFYLKDFKARLRLQNGCIQINLDGPFGKLDAEIFITYENSILCARVKTNFIEDEGIKISLERYGSRTYAHWYAFHLREPQIGLNGTNTWVKDNCLLMSHKLTTGDFICALYPEGAEFENKATTSHKVSAAIEQSPKEFIFYATCTSPFDEQADEEIAISTLKFAAQQGFDALLSKNEICWKNFWEKSFIETDDDYLDNLWHLNLYYSCAGQRGKYPGRFINSLWNWNRDVQPWNFYFHWNQQEIYWGLNAAGHHELCESYLNYRFNGMEHAREDAERFFGVKDGLWVSDVCERRGYNSVVQHEINNHTPVAEIALDFWRQYLYTGDVDFLKNKALPYMLGAARFFASLFIKESDGKYHAKGGNAYEGWHMLYDPITELAMANVLFECVLRGLELCELTDPNTELFVDIINNIAPIKLLDSDPRIVKHTEEGSNTIQLGMFKGKNVSSPKVFALGCVKDYPYHKEFCELIKANVDKQFEPFMNKYIPQYFPANNDISDKKMLDGNDIVLKMLNDFIPTNTIKEIVSFDSSCHHPQANIAPVFPMGYVGIKDKGTDIYDAAVTTALTSRNSQKMGWDPMPIALARLGLSDEVDAYIYDYPSTWQYYNNGFGHYGPNRWFIADKVSPFRRQAVSYVEGNTESEEKFMTETFPFRHMGLEPLGVLSTVMNERLLQSYDGVVRIVPAYGKRNARFKLHAVGGFEVMCEVIDGIPAFVSIRSLRGEILKFENPWTEAWCNNQKYSSSIIEINTEAGMTYLFTNNAEWNLSYKEEVPLQNNSFKIREDKKAMLGLGRSF